MSAQIAEFAAIRAIIERCSGNDKAWAGVFPYAAPSNTPLPFVVLFLAGGGAANDSIYKDDAELLFTVKIIAKELVEAMNCCAQLRGLLDNRGVYDARPDGEHPLSFGNQWIINTTTAERSIMLREMLDGEPIFHQGFQLRMVLKQA